MDELRGLAEKGMKILRLLLLAPLVLVVLIFVANVPFWELPWHIGGGGRASALAEIKAIEQYCVLREHKLQQEGGSRKRVTSRVPCDTVDAEIAMRPAGTRLIRRGTRLSLAFETAAGQKIETTVSPRSVGLKQGEATVGSRLQISYERRRPARTVRAARTGGATPVGLLPAALKSLALALTLLVPLIIFAGLARYVSTAIKQIARTFADSLQNQAQGISQKAASRKAAASAAGKTANRSAWKETAYRQRSAQQQRSKRQPVVQRVSWF